MRSNPSMRTRGNATGLCLALAAFVWSPGVPAHCAGNHAGDHPHCTGGDGGDSGEAIPLVCTLSDLLGDTVLSDAGDNYIDGVDKVGCSTGGTSQPNLSGIAFNTVTSGPVKKAIRFLDLAFSGCTTDYECSILPAEFFTSGSLESGLISVRPYPEQDHIQNLAPDTLYSMAGRIAPKGYAERWSFQMMGRVFPPEFHQGVWCDLEQNPGFDPEDAISQDVTVYLWPDGDGNGVADGYTITTGAIAAGGSPPAVTPGIRLATICSDAGQLVCQGPSNGDLCNLLGQVEVQFTLHTENK